MKQKLDTPMTKNDLEFEIDTLEARIDIKFDNLERKIDDNARKYRDDVLTSIDKVLAQLETITTEHALRNRDLEELKTQTFNHKKRISKLEKAAATT